MPDDDQLRLGHPWAVRGVSAEARQAAAQAARRAGMKLGPWLERLVLAAVKEPPKQKRRREVEDPTNEAAVRQLARDMMTMKTDIANIGYGLSSLVAKHAEASGIAVQKAPPPGKKPK